ncbi:MAG: cyclic nucleotide-binding domain-containing protein [Bacteroidota bacterium]
MEVDLESFGNFSDKEVALLKNELVNRTLDKGEFLLKEGEINRALVFVVRGSLYQFGVSAANEPQYIDLYTSGDWMLNHQSFTTQEPSEYAIQAFEKSDILELTVEALHKLIGISQTFFQLGKILERGASRMRFFDKSYSPDEKYLYLLNHHPSYIRTFPQKMIASYLKITPETLSRVRKRLA